MTNNRVIELTDREVQAEAYFNDLLDRGVTLRLAMLETRGRYRRSCRAVFYRWLMSGRAC